jgi:hypothetical protein
LFALERDSLDPVTANTLLTRGDVIDGDIWIVILNPNF